MPQVQFKCSSCGHNKLCLIISQITEYRVIQSMCDYGPEESTDDLSGIVPTTGTYKTEGGIQRGFCCFSCKMSIEPTNNEQLWNWLQINNMLSNQWSE